MKIVVDAMGGDQAPAVVVDGAVQAAQECTCQAVTLSRQWRTHGRGNRAKGSPRTMTLATKETLPPGIPRRYPFEFKAPGGPATYHGHYLNLDWYVRATAEVQSVWGALFARDPRQEAEILLQPAKKESR